MRLLERLEDDERLEGLLESLERRAPDPDVDANGCSDSMQADLWCAPCHP
jgi:hypothetical protein